MDKRGRRGTAIIAAVLTVVVRCLRVGGRCWEADFAAVGGLYHGGFVGAMVTGDGTRRDRTG